MNEIDPLDAHIFRILGATHAAADPAVLARARARIGAMVEVPRPLAWLGTPAALVTACALFVAVAGVSATIVGSESASSRDATLVSSLVGDDGSYGLPAAATARTATGVSDTGAVTP